MNKRQHADPGYGDPNAPVGSVEWAKRWRLLFQGAIKDLPSATTHNFAMYEVGQKHRAWTLITDGEGRPYRDFDSFCRDKQPWGLGIEPEKFRAHLRAELGERAADLETVAESQQGKRTDKDTSHIECGKSDGQGRRKAENLRAINRAPEVVREMYKAGRITQADAARLGPDGPTAEQAEAVAEAARQLDAMPRHLKGGEARKAAKEVVTECLGGKVRTPLDDLRRAWARASAEERAAFLAEVTD